MAIQALRLRLNPVAEGWRVEASRGDQSETILVPAVDFHGRRLPCPPGQDAATVARRLDPRTALEALEAGRFLLEVFVPVALRGPGPVVIAAAAEDLGLRLPWALLADEAGHLISRPEGALLREVQGEVPLATPLRLPLRVLFVVAAGLDDPAIAAGAEYLGLLRRLDAQDLHIEHQVRVRPTLLELETAISHFQPQVVHWIGHGDATSLRLPADSDTPQISAGRLAALCVGVVVVVLNACHAAGSEEAATPLAAEMVRQGVPVVVGMQGRVKDRSCRMFTWQLYRALAGGLPLAEAVAEGQRAGLVDQPDRLEWARPALFVRAGAQLTPDVTHHAAALREMEIRRSFQTRRAWFCGRFVALGAALGLKHSKGGSHTVLLVRHDPLAFGRAGDKVGLTWLLDEVAGRLAAAGRVPVELLFPAPEDEVPTDWKGLADAFSRAVRLSRKDLGLEGRGQALRDFADRALTIDVRDLVEEFAAALRLDLGALATESGREPVLVLDDLHRLRDMGAALLTEAVGPFGLGSAALPIPLVAGYAESRQPEYAGAVSALKTFADNARHTVKVLSVGPFVGDEEVLAYQQFLVGQEKPLAFSGVEDAKAQTLLRSAIKGVPSRLPEGLDTIDVLKEFGWLEEANDEVLLKVKLA